MRALVVATDAGLLKDARAVMAARRIAVVELSARSDKPELGALDLAVMEAPDREEAMEHLRWLRIHAAGCPVLLVVPPDTGAETELLGAGAADIAVTPVARSMLDARVALLSRRLESREEVDFHELPLTTIVEAMGDTVEITSPEVVIEYVNPAFERTMGYTRAETIGNTPAKLLSSGTHSREFFEDMERTLVAGKTWRGVLISKRKDGSLAHLESTIAPIINELGVVTHRVAIKRDITERMEQERALRESEHRYELAVRGSNEGIWDYDHQTGEMFFSDRWLQIIGLERGAMAPSLDAWFERVHPDDADSVKRAFEAQIAGVSSHLLSEHRMLHRDGSWVFVHARGASEYEGESGTLRISGSLADVTALRRASAQLEAARDQAVQANRTKTLFLANMSHELRTPLNAIIGYSEMLQEDAEDDGEEQAAADLGRIKSAAGHLLTLINDILDISKIEAGKMELYVETVDLDGLADSLADEYRGLVEKSGNRFEYVRQGELGQVKTDVTKVRQTLINLLGNANKFTRDGTVSMRATRDGGWIQFSIVDTGIGMSDEQVERLFRPFVQGDASTTREFGGTGLGLAISQRYCQMMGGKISVSSVQGKGSTFSVRLPSQSLETAPVERRRGDSEEARILVIDDEESMRDLLRRTLAKRGFEVHCAQSGPEGIQMAERLLPDAIVLDVMMPGMDGWSVLTDLKTSAKLSAIPVVMLTIVDQKELGIMLGAADYLLKPVDPDRLGLVLRRVRGPSDVGGTVLLVEDDQDTRELYSRVLFGDGWLVEAATNGREALDLLYSGIKPDVIVLDLMMPEMDGFEFAARLRADSRWVSIPIVVATAKDLTAEERDRLSLSCDRILQKGAFTKAELCQRVNEVLTSMVGPVGDDL